MRGEFRVIHMIPNGPENRTCLFADRLILWERICVPGRRQRKRERERERERRDRERRWLHRSFLEFNPSSLPRSLCTSAKTISHFLHSALAALFLFWDRVQGSSRTSLLYITPWTPSSSWHARWRIHQPPLNTLSQATVYFNISARNGATLRATCYFA